MSKEPWLTQAELATALKCSRRHIQRLDPPHMLVGGMKRYLLSEVERFFRDGPQPGSNVVRLPRRRTEEAA